MESKTLSEKLKRHGSKCETDILMVKKEVLVGHCLGGIQVVGIQRGKELYYGTEAQDWGTGTILIYKIDVWQILDFRR